MRSLKGMEVPKSLITPEAKSFIRKYKTLKRVQESANQMAEVEKMKQKNLGAFFQKLQGYWDLLKQQMPKEFVTGLDGMDFPVEEAQKPQGLIPRTPEQMERGGVE